MVNFTNPGVLGDAAYFRRYYEVSLYVYFVIHRLYKYIMIPIVF